MEYEQMRDGERREGTPGNVTLSHENGARRTKPPKIFQKVLLYLINAAQVTSYQRELKNGLVWIDPSQDRRDVADPALFLGSP